MAGEVIGFGPFRVIASERLLLRGDVPVDLGSRGLDVLLALIEAEGQVVSREDLFERAWPNMVVGEGSLRVTIAGLRKALGDGQDGVRYIANVTGRGYCFVAPLHRLPSTFGSKPVSRPASAAAGGSLPPQPAKMVGRDEVVAALAASLLERRFISIVGPGGLGKTTVAIAVAHASLPHFDGGVYFVDLAGISDATLIPAAVAAELGVVVQSQDPVAGLVAYLEDRQLLLVLDNCEHVLEAAVRLVERISASAPQVHLLATSREALRAEGETVHLLVPLAYPVFRDDLTMEEVLSTPAVQLFLDRAEASGHASPLTGADALTVAQICSRLDGMALAIELAAGRVGAYGFQGTADLLDNRFGLLWQGRRTALPRHQTMSAMLDWSYNLLSERDRLVLSRLSMFTGPFTLRGAQAVVADDEVDAWEVVEAVGSLIDKSLVSVSRDDGTTSHRLLDLTRTYAAEKLAAAEFQQLARRHARYYAGRAPASVEGAVLVSELGDVRAALEWCFSAEGDAVVGVRVAAAAAPVFLAASLLVECRRWCEKALAKLTAGGEGLDLRLVLQTALATSAMFTQGNSDYVRRVIEDGLSSAEAIGDLGHQMTLLAGLHIFLTRVGDFRGALDVAERGHAISRQIGTAGAMATGEWMLGCSYHLVGDQARAQLHCQLGFEAAAVEEAGDADLFGYDHRIRSLIVLARALWLRGYHDQAVRVARQAIEEADALGQPINICIALIYASTVLLWAGELDAAQVQIERLVGHAKRFSLAPYHAVGLALEGELWVARGEAREGVAQLRRALLLLKVERHNVLTASFYRALGEGLMLLGEADEAAAVIEEALARGGEVGEPLGTPELLRIRGEIWCRVEPPDVVRAEAAFHAAVDQARAQFSPSLELRATMALARLLANRGDGEEAVQQLEAVLAGFTEGAGTTDLLAARSLLAELRTEGSLKEIAVANTK